MSIDINIIVVGKSAQEVKNSINKEKLGIIDGDNIIIAGFSYSITDEPLDKAEVRELKKCDLFREWMLKTHTRLDNTTNMGWSYHGDIRNLQKPIAHMIAQVLAIELDAQVLVDNPQSGHQVYYRRTRHPNVHVVFNNRNKTVNLNCPNYCEQKEDEDGKWIACGYETINQRISILGNLVEPS